MTKNHCLIIKSKIFKIKMNRVNRVKKNMNK